MADGGDHRGGQGNRRRGHGGGPRRYLAVIWLLAALIILGPLAGARAEKAPDLAAVNARQIGLKRAALIRIDGRIEYLLSAAKKDKKALAAAYKTLMVAQAQYAQTLRTQILLASEKSGSADRYRPQKLCRGYISARNSFINKRRERIDFANSLIKGQANDRTKAERFGEAKGRLRADLLNLMIAAEVAGALFPTINCLAQLKSPTNYAISTNEDGGRSATVRLMGLLAALIGTLDANNVALMPGVPVPFIRKMIKVKQDLVLEQFQRQLHSAVIVDPASLRPIQGQRRDQLRSLILKNFVDYLNHVSKSSFIKKLFWNADGRKQLAQSLLNDLTRNPLHSVNSYLESGLEPEPQRYFRALALGLFAERGMILGQYDKDYLGGSRWSASVSQKLRGFDYWYNDKETGSAVKKRLHAALKELMIVGTAFEKAAENPPEALKASDPAAFELLLGFGYILEFEAEDKAKKYRYHIAGSRQGLALNIRRTKETLALPGATMLKFINAKGLAVTLGSILVPEAGAALVARGAMAVQVSRTGITAARVFTDLAVGTAYDGVIEALERNGKVDFQRLILESVILGSIVNVSGAVVKPTLDAAMQSLARRQRGTKLYAAIESTIRRNPLKSRLFYKAILEPFDMGSEAGISLTFQAYVQNQKVDANALLSMLLNSAIHRTLGKFSASAKDIASTKFKKISPDLYRFFNEHPKVRAEVIKHQERLAADLEVKKQLIRQRLRHEPNPVTQLFTMLLRGDVSWAEVKQIHAKDPGFFGQGIQDLADMRRTFAELLVHDVRIASIDEVNQQMDWREKKVQDANLAAGEKSARMADLAKRRQAEIDLVNADLVAPGSKDPSSDIDRSSKSTYIRKNLRILFQARARLFTGHDVDFVSSSKSVDVNEYINVFPFIRDTAKFVKQLRNLPVKENDSWNANDKSKPEWPGKFLMRHEDALDALTMSGYMAKMDASQLAQFKVNERAKLEKDIKAGWVKKNDADRSRTMLETKFKFAEKSLASAAKRLAIYEKKFAAELNLDDINDPAVKTEARDHMYDLRNREIRELQWELGKIESDRPPNLQRALALRAHIARRMTLAMRDGIETFTHPASLDIFVIRAQSQRNPDGSKKTMTQLLDDANFDLQGALKMYSRRDIKAVIRDQAKFILEHINGFNRGHEEAYLTGRAMGKYIERVYLAMKIMGLSIDKIRQLPAHHPTKRLFIFARELAKRKPYPDQINDYLRQIARRQPATLANGLAEIFNLVEIVVPGMHGLSGVVPGRRAVPLAHKLAPFARPEPAPVAVKRVRELAFVGGGKLAALYLAGELAITEADLKRYEKALAEMRQLATEVRLPRLNEIRKDLRQLVGVEQNLVSLPWQDQRSATYQAQTRLRNRLKIKIAEARREKRTDGIDLILEGDPASREYRRLKGRVKWLRTHLKWLRASLQKAKARAANEAKFAKLNLSGNWLCDGPGAIKWLGRIQHKENEVQMEFRRKEGGRNLVEAVFQASHRFGVLRGFWIDTQSRTEPMLARQRVSNTRMAFRASVDPDNHAITFTQAAGHPRTLYRWDGAICRRQRGEAAVPKVGFLQYRKIDAPGDLAHLLLGDDRKLKYGMFKIVARTDRGIEPFLRKDGYREKDDYTILLGKRRVGKLVFPNLMLPGKYRLLLRSGGQTKRKKFSITAGKVSEVTVLMGRLKITQSTAKVPIAVAQAKIYRHDNEKVPVRAYRLGAPGRHSEPPGTFRLPPGRYSIELGSGGAMSTWLRGIDVIAASLREVNYRLSSITLEFKQQLLPMGVRLRPATSSDQDSVEWTGLQKSRLKFNGNSVTLMLPPGKYEVQVPTQKGMKGHKFSLAKNQSKTVKVK